MFQHARPRRTAPVVALVLTLVLTSAACGGDDSGTANEEPSPTAAPTAEPSTEPSGDLAVVAGEPFPEARCAANEAAGTITFLTGFDYAAAS